MGQIPLIAGPAEGLISGADPKSGASQTWRRGVRTSPSNL